MSSPAVTLARPFLARSDINREVRVLAQIGTASVLIYIAHKPQWRPACSIQSNCVEHAYAHVRSLHANTPGQSNRFVKSESDFTFSP